MNFQDMKIQIHYRKVDLPLMCLQELGYPSNEFVGIQVTESRRGEMPDPEIIPYTQARKDALEPLVEKLQKERKTMSLDEVAQLGKELADFLFHGTVRDLLVRCMDYAEDQGEGLRLRLILKDPQTARLPWEYVYHQRIAGEKATWSGFLALDPHISIVRHEPMLVTSRTVVPQERPLKVFMAFAEPKGVGEDLDQETVRDDIVKALEEKVVPRIELTVDEHLTVENLDNVAGYGIFNFSGHGDYLTDDELAYYRELYRVKEEDETEAEAIAQPEQEDLFQADRATLRAGFERRQKKALLYKADRDALRAGFERRPKPDPTADEHNEPDDGALRTADRDTLRAGFMRREEKYTRHIADRATLTAGFARRRNRRAATQDQTPTRDDAESSQGILVLEKDGGHPHFYPAQNLAQRLKRTGVSVVVMDACYSAKITNIYDKWSSMASALVRVGIPAVVAMQYAFSDPAAKAFWPAFYETVAAGLSLDEAVSAGRLAIIDLEPEPSEENPDVLLTGQNDFGFPALYMRSEDGLLFPELTNDPDLDDARSNIIGKQGFLQNTMTPGPGTLMGATRSGADTGLPAELSPELTTLKHLVRTSPDGDFVYIYYAGKSATPPPFPIPPPDLQE